MLCPPVSNLWIARGFNPCLLRRLHRVLRIERQWLAWIPLLEILCRGTIIGRLGLRARLVCTNLTLGTIIGAIHSGGEMEVGLTLAEVVMVATITVMGAVATKITRILSGILIRILVVKISTCGIKGPDRGVLWDRHRLLLVLCLFELMQLLWVSLVSCISCEFKILNSWVVWMFEFKWMHLYINIYILMWFEKHNNGN